MNLLTFGASWLPLILLVGVAAHQRWRMLHVHQSSWKGGGFAMFSTAVERAPLAELVVEAENGALSVVRTMEDSDDRRFKASMIPTRRYFMDWGRALAGTTWQRGGSGVHRCLPSSVSPLTVTRVVVKNRTVHFDLRTETYVSSDHEEYVIDCNPR